MKIRLGPAGIPASAKGGDSISGVRKVKELGLQAMEVEFVRGVNMSEELALELGKVAKQLDVALSVHAPYYINLLAKEKKILEASKQRILASLERGSWMGATAVAVHTGFYMGRPPEKCYGLVKEQCSDILRRANAGGLNCSLALETAGKLSSFGRVREIVKLHAELPEIVPCIDFAHVFACNNGFIDYGLILDKLESVGIKKIYGHFSAIAYTEKGERNHLPLEAGGPAFGPLAGEILRRKLSATLICESPLLEMDALVMKRAFEKLGYEF
jgi:deoxyribonuclease-4